MKKPTITDFYEMAYHFYQGGQYEQSERTFRLLTCLDTRNCNHWMGLASALKMQKKYQDAINAFYAVVMLETGESNPLPHAYAAECFYALGQKDKAKRALTQAQKIAKKDEKYSRLSDQLKIFQTRGFTV